MVQALIWSERQLPGAAPESYKPFGFAKFGLCCWNYGGWDGQIEWINTAFFMTISKYPNPTKLRYWAANGVQMTIQMQQSPVPDVPDVAINAALVNLVSGKGMPLTVVP